MSIFALPRPPVKRTRHSPRHDRPFGEGILPDRSERRVPYTQADLDWAAQSFNADATGPSDEDLDFEAGCAMAQARMDAGFGLF